MDKVSETNGTAVVPVASPVAGKTEIMPLTLAEQHAMKVLTHGDERLQSMYCSAPTDDPKWQAAILRASQDQDCRPEDVGKAPWLTEHVLAHDVTIHDEETGELRELVRIVLLGPDGRSLAMVSEGARRSLRMLLQLFGLPPWKKPLPIVIKAMKTRRGYRTYALDVDHAALAKTLKGDKGEGK